MADFPKLKTGAVTQYPSERHVEYSTRVLSFIGGAEQRWREMRSGGRRWVLCLAQVDETEMNDIAAFFHDQNGRLGRFSFEDPWDGTVFPDCSFDQDDFTVSCAGEGRLSAMVQLRENR